MKKNTIEISTVLSYALFVFTLVCISVTIQADAQVNTNGAMQVQTTAPATATATPSATTQSPTNNTQAKNSDPVLPKRKECKAIEEQRAADCKNKSPKQQDSIGGYVCQGGKLANGYGLTTETSSGQKSGVGCVSEKAITTKTKNKACGNEYGIKTSADKNSCRDGVTRFVNDAGLTKEKVASAGIKCFSEEEAADEGGKKKKYVTICNDKEDQDALRKLVQGSDDEGKVMNDAGRPQGGPDLTPGTQLASLDNKTPGQKTKFTDEAVSSGGGQDSTAGTSKKGGASEVQVDKSQTATSPQEKKGGLATKASFVTSDDTPSTGTKMTNTSPKEQTVRNAFSSESGVGERPQETAAQNNNTGKVKYSEYGNVTTAPPTKTVQQQNQQVNQIQDTPPTKNTDTYNPNQGNQEQRRNDQQQRRQQNSTYPSRNETYPQQKVASNSLFDSIFNRPKEPQANVTTNAQIVPWYWQNNYLKPQATKPAATRVSDQTDQQKATTSIDLTTNGAPTTSLKPSGLVSVAGARDTSAVPMTPEEEAQARFLKSILEAPSVEEVMKRGGYDYTKLQEAAKEKALADAVAQKDTTQPEQKPTTSILTSIRKSAETLTGKGDSKTEPQKPVLAYASDNQQNVKQQTTSNDPEERQRVVLESIFAQQLKTGELAPKTDGKGIVQVNQTAVQIEKVEVALEVVYKMLKNMTTQLTNSQKSPLTASERDKMANQLFSLSDYLQGSTFNADQPTAEMMNAVAQQLEIAANRAAENASAETILSSLRAALSELALEQQSKKDGVVAVGASMPTAVADWTPEHFAAFKKMITDSLNAAKNPVAIKMYRDALSRISTAELFKQSNQAYWDSQADLVEAQTKIALARSLERSSNAYPSIETQTESKVLPKKPESPLAFVTGQQKPGDGEETFVTTNDVSFVAMGGDADMPEPPETTPPSEAKGIIRSLIDWIFGW